MMHDLLLQLPAAMSFDDVQERVRADDELGPLVNEENTTPEQLVLADPDTAVYAVLTPSAPAPLEEMPEEDGPDLVEGESAVVLFQIPYLRPRFFALQGAGWAIRAAKLLEAAIADPQEGGDPRARTEAEIVSSWERAHAEYQRGLTEPGEEGAPPQEPPRPVAASLLDAVFAHNHGRKELRAAAGPGVDVPGLVLAVIPLRREPAAVCRYTAGDPTWLPDAATHVVLERMRKTWLGGKREEVVVDAAGLRAAIAAFEVAGAPKGVRGYGAGKPGNDPMWAALEGPPARGLALLDWAGVVDTSEP